MKILQITPFFYPVVHGGVTYILNLGQNLLQRGHRVDILTVNTENAPKKEVMAGNIRVYRCSLDFRYNKGLISREFARRLFQAKDHDVYHIHAPFALGLEIAVAASKINHIPLVATHHGDGTITDTLYSMIAKSYSKFSRGISFQYVDRLIFLTRSYSESLWLSPKARKKISIVKTGVDTHRFSPQNDGSVLRAKYGFDSNDKVLLFAGALDKDHRYKGVDYLIRAMRQVSNDKGHIKLVIVGGGELVPELKKLAQELNLGRDVIFTGSVPHEQLPPYYAMCDIFVLPSISGPESCGFVVLEAMASGKPAIVSDLPGVRDNVEEGRTGLKVPPKDSQALAQTILRLAEDDSLRNEMAHNARAEVKNYSWQKCAAETEVIYNEVVRSESIYESRVYHV